MKTKLLAIGFSFGILISSGVWGIPTFSQYKSSDNFLNLNDCLVPVISDQGVSKGTADRQQDFLLNLISESAAVNGADELQSLAKVNNLDIINSGSAAQKSADTLNAYTFITDSFKNRSVSPWEANPDSPDLNPLRGSTVVVPAPGALLLGAIGAVIIGWLRKSRMLS